MTDDTTKARSSGRGVSRADFLRLAGGAALALGTAPLLGRAGPAAAMARRAIPATGERLPVIGLGTARVFDYAPGAAEYAGLADVLAALAAAGGTVIDTSPMYGRAEETAGELLAAAGAHHRSFVATKVWTRGRAEGIRQMEDSFRRLRAQRIDLMQVHNLVDWRTQLATLREWKAAGRIRYLGVTHYTDGAYDELEAVMRAEPLDFLQINYSLDEPEAERRILPLAAERGMAVLVNRPFGGGGLLRRLVKQPLPPWAAEIGAGSWAQLLLKFVLGHPATTCAIPGTRRAEHMADNARAGFGPLPGPDFWRQHRDAI